MRLLSRPSGLRRGLPPNVRTSSAILSPPDAPRPASLWPFCRCTSSISAASSRPFCAEGRPAVCPGQAHVCRAPADPPQERSLMAERESVPEGKDGEHGVRRIPVVLLRKNLLVRENPQKTGCFRPLATLLFILLKYYSKRH